MLPELTSTPSFRDALRQKFSDLPENFRIELSGEVRDANRAYVDAICTCRQPKVDIDASDPFRGHTPSARQLEQMFEDGGKTKFSTVNRPAGPVTLHCESFIYDGKVGQIYVGQCPDCGIVLIMAVR